MSTINTEEITVTLYGNYDLLTEEQKDSLKKLFILISARHKKLDRDIKIHYYNINSSIINKTFEVSGLKNIEENFLEGLEELKELNPNVKQSKIETNEHPLDFSKGLWSVSESGSLENKITLNRKGGKISKKLRGGNCAVVSSVQQPNCLPTPVVEMYKYPCSQLTENQFGFKEMLGFSGGSKKQTKLSKKKKYIKKGGSCGQPVQHCLGSSYANLGKTAISDGAPTDGMTASEGAWFNRYSFGGVASTNEVPKSGGAYSFNLNEKIGGLPALTQTYDEFAPSTTNLQIRSVNPSQNTQTNILNYNERLNLKGGFKKSKSKKNIKGGNAPFPNSLSNEVGNFSPDMLSRKFDCNQPNWSKNCS